MGRRLNEKRGNKTSETLTLSLDRGAEVKENRDGIVDEWGDEELFSDGGAKFVLEFKNAIKNGNATERAKLQKKFDEKIGKLEKEGDDKGQLQHLQAHMRTLNEFAAAWMGREGLSLPAEQDPFVGTLIDDELFAPTPPRPDCPICFLAMPSWTCSAYQPCCGKILCIDCMRAHYESSPNCLCPFCRAPAIVTDDERFILLQKRINANDGDACLEMGRHYRTESLGLKQDYEKALELFHQAVELGSIVAHHFIGVAYLLAIGVKGDKKKSLHHLRLAAIGGVLESRYALAAQAYNSGNLQLAMKHLIVSAKAGHDESMKLIRGIRSRFPKEGFSKVLGAHKAATNVTEQFK